MISEDVGKSGEGGVMAFRAPGNHITSVLHFQGLLRIVTFRLTVAVRAFTTHN